MVEVRVDAADSVLLLILGSVGSGPTFEQDEGC